MQSSLGQVGRPQKGSSRLCKALSDKEAKEQTRRESSVARQRVIGYRLRLLDVSNQYPSPVKARSSVGERFLDTEEVGGSIPPVPTRSVPSAPRFSAMIRFFA